MVTAMSASAGIGPWLATVWRRPGQASIAMHWLLGFVLLLVTGLFASASLLSDGPERSLHDTYYAVAHFRYVLSLGAVFAFFAAWYYLFPKLTGRAYSGTLGRLHFWLTFIGANVLFFPQHFLDLAGMPRRIADYPDAFTFWNHVSSIGSYMIAAGTLVFAAVTLHTCFAAEGRRHG
jgi:cytochrome c oxidase subunit 1